MIARKHTTLPATMITLVALALTGCGVPDTPTAGVAPTSAVANTKPPGDVLVIRQSADQREMLAQISASGGWQDVTIPLGVPSPDHSLVYTLEAGNGRTTLHAIDAQSGVIQRSKIIDGQYQLADVGLNGMPSGLSPNGQWLVLVDRPSATAGQEQGKFAIVDTTFAKEPQIVQLNGKFSFDAIDNQAASLYVTEHLERDMSKYQVRRYDMQAKAMDERVVVDKSNNSVMRGVRHVSLPSANGEWLFTLYLNNAQGPFIHALSLNNAIAMCVPLLADNKDDHVRQLHWSLALSPDGSRLYAVNGALGLASTLDAASPYNVTHARTDGDTPDKPVHDASTHKHDAQAQTVIESDLAVPPGYAPITADGQTIYTVGMTGVTVFDTATMKRRTTLLDPTAFDSVVLSPDGQQLYAASGKDSKIVAINTATGNVDQTIEHVPMLEDVLWIAPRRS